VKNLRGNYFHPSCLFTNNLLTFKNRCLHIPTNLLWNNIEAAISEGYAFKCAVCLEFRGIKIKCDKCPNHVHLICGYLYGSKINIIEEREADQISQLKVSLECHCHHQRDLINNIFLRRYPINYKGAATISDYWEKMEDPFMANVIV
jgi:PHD-zinc-finger like domain